MPRRVLITGVGGFTGRHLAQFLSTDANVLVFGTGRQAVPSALLAGYRPCDITDENDVRELVEWAQPDVVYHLAACWGAASAAELERVNVGGFRNVRESLRQSVGHRQVRMLVIGSAAEIGPVSSEQLPADEAVACRPVTAYGASKHAVVTAALAQPLVDGVEIVVARPFNLVGAGLDRRLAPGAFAAAVRAVARGETDSIRCGWLGGKRDFLDINDAVRAYSLLVDRAPPGSLVNVCSGRSVLLADLLARLLTLAGLEAKVVAQTAPGDHEIADIRGSHARLSALTGWQPEVPLSASLAALYASTET